MVSFLNSEERDCWKDGVVVKFGSLTVALVAGSLFCLTQGCGSDAQSEDTTSTEPQAAVSQPSSDLKPAAPEVSTKMENDVIVTVNGKTLNRSMANAMMQEMMGRQGVPPEDLCQCARSFPARDPGRDGR